MIDVKFYNIQYDLGIKNINTIDYDKLFELDRTYVKENGNIEYLIRVYQTGRLLESNTNQGYHPPLHHFIAAGVMRICDLFGASNEFKLEAAEFPAFIYSIIIILVIYQITKELEFTDKTKILIMLLTAFNPLLIFLSRLINNDPLVTLFIIISVLYLIKWYKLPSLKNTIILALAIGLGASTKISIIVMILPLFITYLKKLSKEIDNFDIVKKIIIYGLVFTLIVTPLIFWYPIRNAIKFGQPIFGIVTASPEFKIGHNDFVNRWLINNELFTNQLLLNSSNVFSYVINSSILFVTEEVFLSNIFLHAMRLITILLLLVACVSTVKYYRSNDIYTIFLLTNITWILSFIYFNVSLPYSCTMHSRYIVIIFIINMFFIGKMYENSERKWLKNLINILVCLYSLGAIGIISTILYLL